MKRSLDVSVRKLGEFRALPAAHSGRFGGETAVTCRTSGIGREMGVIPTREAGVENLLQRDRGILACFLQTQSARRWRDRCFVLDERESFECALGPLAA